MKKLFLVLLFILFVIQKNYSQTAKVRKSGQSTPSNSWSFVAIPDRGAYCSANKANIV